MPSALDANHILTLCRGDFYHSGSHNPVLRRDEALPAQGRESYETRAQTTELTTSNSIQSSLRQMVYLVIKELSSVAEDVIMVTSSIMKDMQPNLEVIYRPNAIRALARIIDVCLPTARARTSVLNTCALSRHLPSCPPSDFSSLLSSIETLQFPPRQSFPRITFTRLPKM